MDISMSITQFLSSGRQVGWTDKTLEGYRWRLEHLRKWLVEHDVTNASQLDRDKLRSYGASLWNDWKPATIKGSVGCVRSYLHWLADERLASEELVSALRIPRVPKRRQRTISPAEYMALMKACSRPVEHGLTERQALKSAVRNAALVSLLYDSILRASELVALKVEDIDLEHRTVYVAQGKGGDFRYSSFSKDTALTLREWLKLRRAAPGVPSLFVSITGNTPGQGLTVRGLRSILKSLGDRAGVPDVTPHAFRRGGATAKMVNGMPVRQLQEEAGWASVTMADIYTRAYTLSPEEAPELEQYSPVATAKLKNGKVSGRARM